MIPDRRTASVVGVLFILATAFSLASSAMFVPLLSGSDYLAQVSANVNQVIVGVLLLLAAAISIFLIPAMMFPVLRRTNEGLALGYLGFRTIEAVTLVVDSIALLSLVSAGQQHARVGALTAPTLQTWGAMSLAIHNWMFDLNPVVFGLGALLFYCLLYRWRLVPRWISIWGVIGAVLVFTFGLLALFGTSLVLLALPIGVQEQALAVWLILKGFSQTGLASFFVKGLESQT
jgi:hypothetical protein